METTKNDELGENFRCPCCNISFSEWKNLTGHVYDSLHCFMPFYDIEEVDELDETARGEGGFGSTGTH